MGREWGGNGRDGNGEISLRATWDQGGRILSQQGGFQVSKGEWKGEQREVSMGKQKARGSRHIYCNLYMYIMIACNCQNDCQFVCVYIMIA
jgi:hypothetical protein